MKCFVGLVLFVSATYGYLLEAGNRNVTKILRVSNGGQYGVWSTPQFCPPMTFATGYQLKIETDQFIGDDTALDAINLICSDTNGHPRLGDYVTSGQAAFGTWSKTETCNQLFHLTSYLTSFQLQVEGPQDSGDDTAANFLKFHCRDLPGNNTETEIALPPGGYIWGKWGDWSDSCDHNEAICGLNTKVEPEQAAGMDTALNDVVFYCCNDVIDPSIPVGK